MKKVLIVLALAVLVVGCTPKEQADNKDKLSGGVWISYSEINTMLDNEDGFENEFHKVVENCKELKIQNLYIHVRAFCDSLFKSDYYPLIERAQKYDFDVFKFIVDECHKNNIKVHAWINPYRVSTATTNIDEISNTSPAYKWLKDDNKDNDCNVSFANGIYLNPSEQTVQGLVIDGIREIVVKYDVDGIHFDDYFYPTTDSGFDKVSYEKYKSSAENPMSLEDWRRSNVNALVSGCYNAIKYANEDIVFSISPMASIENNYNNLYADVKYWVDKGYIDCIIPQLYFGFDYPDENFKFLNLLNDWKKIVETSDTELLIGLANYKAVPELAADMEEWQNNFDIVARQIEICKNDDKVSGFVLFSYSCVFGEREEYTKQRENILEYLKSEDINE